MSHERRTGLWLILAFVAAFALFIVVLCLHFYNREQARSDSEPDSPPYGVVSGVPHST